MTSSFPHPELPTGAFLAVIVVLIPLPWHWRARNVATIAIMLWLFVINLINAVNSIVWAGNIDIRIPVWCDITTKIYIGASYALPAATTCICKHLELVSSNRNARLDHRDRRNRMIFDLCMCFGLPVIFMALHYIVQGHRFDIIEDIGCQPAIYNSIPGILILYFPPLLLSTITFIYAAFALAHFIRRRIDFGRHLQRSDSALTSSRYVRLIAMSITEMVLGTAINAFTVYSNVAVGLRPYTSWADVHSDFGRIAQWPTVFLTPSIRRDEMVLWWALPVSAFVFFLFFGLGEEAFKEYRKGVSWVRRNVFRQKGQDKPAFSIKPPSRRNPPAVLSSLPVLHIKSDLEKGSQSDTYIDGSPIKESAPETPYTTSSFGYEYPSTSPSSSYHHYTAEFESHEEPPPVPAYHLPLGPH